LLCGFATTAAAATGPTSELFVTSKALGGGGTSAVDVVHQDQLVRSWTCDYGNELALAVQSSVRTLGLHNLPAPGDEGAEYTLAGIPTGVKYPMPIVSESAALFTDGASDGVHNYAWDFNRSIAYRFDGDWANPVELFRIQDPIPRAGIAYDPTNHSLWMSGYGNSMIENWSLDGTLLDSFQVTHARSAGLAIDPSDRSLWVVSVSHPGTIDRFARTGAFHRAPLSSRTFEALQTRAVMGAEFAVAPLRWKLDASGDWSSAENWDGPVPDGADAVANFTGAITAPRTVVLDSPRTVGRLNFDNLSSYTITGAAGLTLASSDGAAQVNVGYGAHGIAAPLVLAGNTRVATLRAESSLELSGGITPQGAASVALNKTGPGELRAASIRAAALNVTDGALQLLAKPGADDPAGLSVVKSLTIASTAQLDLTNNLLIIDYTGPSPQATLRTWLVDGRLSSSLAATGTSLGYGEAAVLGLSSLEGHTLDATSLLVRLTWVGDCDLDGDVDIGDLGRLASGWQSAGVWTAGDFDHSGSVDVNDLGLLASNWQAGVGNPLSPALDNTLRALGLATMSVPEPAGLTLMLVVVLIRRRPHPH
jgi:hypothetical protein